MRKVQIQNLALQCITWVKKKSQKRLLIEVSCVFFAGILLLMLFSKKAKDESKKEIPFAVQVLKLQAESVPLTLTLSGSTKASREVTLRAETEGAVQEILSKEGTHVQPNQSIAKLKEEDRPARLLEAQASLKQRVIETKADNKLGAKGFKAENTLAQSQAALEKAKADLISAEKAVHNLVIRAPFEGLIEKKFVDVGDYLTKGGPVAKVLDLNPLKVISYASEKDIHSLTIGTEANITFPHFHLNKKEELKGKISFLSKEADPKTRTYRIEFQIPNPDFTIPAGLTTHISLKTKGVEAHKIPASALTLNDEGLVGVKIALDGKAFFKPVQILESTPNHVIVTGLPAQSTLITYGADFVTSDQKISYQEQSTKQ